MDDLSKIEGRFPRIYFIVTELSSMLDFIAGKLEEKSLNTPTSATQDAALENFYIKQLLITIWHHLFLVDDRGNSLKGGN